MARFRRLRLRWVPREQNEEAYRAAEAEARQRRARSLVGGARPLGGSLYSVAPSHRHREPYTVDVGGGNAHLRPTTRGEAPSANTCWPRGWRLA
jgi:hypothetical protein